ncbi:MAG: 50S ribosomal protein L18 [Christensenellaceae bacterium]|jgi:large subunit ribosomal protein L18|nr:50S ribosomal protein L18 [Christensenellaceae bacterium]
MIKQANKNEQRQPRHLRVRGKISGTKECPRLNVYRSTTHIYAQVMDDSKGVTLISASTVEKSIADAIAGKNKKEQAFIVGEQVAKRAVKKGIKSVVFDRGGYIYTGRVQALADGARSGGLKF